MVDFSRQLMYGHEAKWDHTLFDAFEKTGSVSGREPLDACGQTRRKINLRRKSNAEPEKY
jgi:hypothetical protein